MKRLLINALFFQVAVLAATLAFWNPLSARQDLTLSGRVVNGTEGATLEPGLAVSLHAFDRDSGGVTTQTAEVDADGAFAFNVPGPAGERTFAVVADYAGHRYSTPLMSHYERPHDLVLTVYESTQDVGVISVQHHTMFLNQVAQSDRVMQAGELVKLTNDSDRTLVPDLANAGPGMFSFLRFSLPPGATDFDIQTDLVGGEIIPVGTGFALTAPVLPGRHSVTFRFAFPYDGTSLSYRQNLLQGADAFRVLVPERLGPIQVNGLTPAPAIDIEGAVFNVWEQKDIPPGQGVLLELSNLPQPSLWQWFAATISEATLWLLVIPSALGAVLAAVLLYGASRRPRPVLANVLFPPAATNPPLHLTPEHRRLVREIAALDHQFQQGRLPEEEYRPHRDALKEDLVAAVQPTPGPGLPATGNWGDSALGEPVEPRTDREE